MERGEFKAAQVQAWSSGDYRPIGRMLEPAALALVEAAGVGAGDRVLDVATGSGTVAVAAATAGAKVIGVDITDAVFDEGRQRAAEAGLDVMLQVGDAEDLSFDDGAFGVVLSSFGAVMAPDHAAVAAELVRVCRPGGTIAMTAWPRDGAGTALLAPIAEHLPDPPDFVEPHTDWGDPSHVADLLEPLGVQLEFEGDVLPITFPSIDGFEDVVFQNGPIIKAREALIGMGVWEDAHRNWRAAVEAANEADDGTFRMTWDYLRVVGTVEGG